VFDIPEFAFQNREKSYVDHKAPSPNVRFGKKPECHGVIDKKVDFFPIQ